MSATCKSCGRSVVWARTNDGSVIALDNSLQTYTIVLDQQGKIEGCEPVKDANFERQYINHSDVCTGRADRRPDTPIDQSEDGTRWEFLLDLDSTPDIDLNDFEADFLANNLAYWRQRNASPRFSPKQRDCIDKMKEKFKNLVRSRQNTTVSPPKRAEPVPKPKPAQSKSRAAADTESDNIPFHHQFRTIQRRHLHHFIASKFRSV